MSYPYFHVEKKSNDDYEGNPHFVYKPYRKRLAELEKAEVNYQAWVMRNAWSPIPSKDPTIRFGWKKPVKKAVPPVKVVMDEKRRKEKGDEAVATLALEGRGPCGKPKTQCKCNDLSLVQQRWKTVPGKVNAGKKIPVKEIKRKKGKTYLTFENQNPNFKPKVWAESGYL